MKISESPEICRARALRNWRYGASSPAEVDRTSQPRLGGTDDAAAGGQVQVDDMTRSAPAALMDW
jgi:hypothetical protein